MFNVLWQSECYPVILYRVTALSENVVIELESKFLLPEHHGIGMQLIDVLEIHFVSKCNTPHWWKSVIVWDLSGILSEKLGVLCCLVCVHVQVKNYVQCFHIFILFCCCRNTCWTSLTIPTLCPVLRRARVWSRIAPIPPWPSCHESARDLTCLSVLWTLSMCVGRSWTDARSTTFNSSLASKHSENCPQQVSHRRLLPVHFSYSSKCFKV